MFIKKLWKENPELVEMAINRIADIDNSGGEWIEFEMIKDGYLIFKVFDHEEGFRFGRYIYLNDFYIGINTTKEHVSRHTIGWIKFMHKICGEEYMQACKKYYSDRPKMLAGLREQQYEGELNQINKV